MSDMKSKEEIQKDIVEGAKKYLRDMISDNAVIIKPVVLRFGKDEYEVTTLLLVLC